MTELALQAVHVFEQDLLHARKLTACLAQVIATIEMPCLCRVTGLLLFVCLLVRLFVCLGCEAVGDKSGTTCSSMTKLYPCYSQKLNKICS